MTASRAGLENKVGLALNEIGEIVGNEKGSCEPFKQSDLQARELCPKQ